MEFQSTHSRGVRRYNMLNSNYFNFNFNPRTHGECDNITYYNNLQNTLFQSTHSRGVRLFFNKFFKTINIFQSTHSRGVRQKRRQCLANIKEYFNPRTHGECDNGYNKYHSCKRRFQSTHSRGVRLHFLAIISC